jgi:electron transport complex protein RnfC
VPGHVTEIRRITLANGTDTEAAVIAMEGEFSRLGKPAVGHDWSSFEPSTILRLIREAGVVELDGSGGAMHLALSEHVAARCSTLVINGAESEPYVTVAHRLMIEHPDELSEAIHIVQRLLSPARTLVGAEQDKTAGLRALRDAARKRTLDLSFVALDTKYPQSDVLQLIRALTGHEVPSGQQPIDIGCVAVSIPTLYAIWEAVVLRKPLIERVITVAGDAVERPANLKVRVGTPIGSVLRECGFIREDAARVVVGGPLRGYGVSDLTTPITKTTSAVLALTSREVKAGPQRDCIECGRCAEVCPMGLNPARLRKLSRSGEHELTLREGLLDCTECGLCSYVCPSRIPLVHTLAVAKESRGRAPSS